MEKNTKKIMLAIFSLLTACLTNAQSSISTNGGYVGTTPPPNALNITVEANELGGLSGSMPFEIPEGFGGVTPQLLLAYNSAEGVSDFGRGFSLGGIATITRSGKDTYHDGVETDVTFTNEDCFYLYRQRMILKSGSNGANGSIYYSETDSYSTIEAKGNTHSAPDSFVVKSLNGNEIVFGSDAKVVVNNKTVQWPIKSFTDKRGNRIVYKYDNTSNGQRRLLSVTYTTNKNSKTIVAQYKINIVYESCSNEVIYVGKQAIKYTHRIKSISVVDNNLNTELNKYTFEYKNNLLSKISKKYRNNDVCNPTTITWINQNIKEVKSSNIDYPASVASQLYGIMPHVSVSEITNGLDVTTEITYTTINNSSTCTKITTSNLPSGVDEYIMPMWVVDNIKTSSESSTYSNVKYTYGNIRVHDKFGILGFKTITQSDLITNLRKNILTFGCIAANNTKAISVLTKKEAYCNGATESTEEYTWKFANKTGAPSKCYVQYLQSYKILGNKVLPKTITQELDINVGQIKKTTINHGGIVTETSEQTFNASGQPTTIKTTRTQNGESVTSSVKMSYDTYGNLIQQTDVEHGHSVTYSYNSNNHTNIVSAYNSATKIKTTYTYDSKNRFVTKVTTTYNNGKTLSTEYTYDSYGFKTSEKSAGGLVTKYEYDKFGQLSNIKNPNGNDMGITYGWSGSSNSKMYVTTTDQMNTKMTYYDVLGRTVVVSSWANDLALATGLAKTITYKGDGNIASIVTSGTSFPFDGTTSYAYNSAGEVSSITSKGRTVYYSKTPTSSTETINGVTKTSKYNNAGQLISVTDITGTITYKYHKTGQVNEINVGGITTKMEFDNFGRQTKLVDADAGTTTYTYDELDRIKTQTDARGVTTTITYDANYGWETKRTETLGSTTRTISTIYYDDAAKFGLVKSQTDSQSGVTTSYEYDVYGNVTKKTDVIDGKEYVFKYTYDTKSGRLTQKEFPDGIRISYSYKGNRLNSIYESSIGKYLQSDIKYYANGQVSSYKQGNGNTVEFTYDQYGYIKSEKFGKSGQTITNSYTFDPVTQNLTWRGTVFSGMYTNLSEKLTYDQADRLIDWQTVAPGGTTNQCVVDYQSNGNITHKSGVGYYMYSKTKPHAMTDIKELGGISAQTRKSEQEYTTFNKVSKITCSNINSTTTFTYGPDNQRRTMTKNGNKTVYVGSSYQVNNNGKQALHYIEGAYGLGALIVRENGKTTIYYLQTDYQGSIVASYKSDGTQWSLYSYDPWGRRRASPNWLYYKVDDQNAVNLNKTNYSLANDASLSLITRGYTGHEHLDEYGLINMNGRLYDYTTARFLSPDPYVQAPTNSQNYNRYSYCLNNPLKYTDPSGYKWKWWQTALGIGMLIDPVSTTATAFAGWSSVENTVIAAGATYSTAIASIPVFQSTMQATDYGVQSIKSTIYMIQDIGGKNYDQDDTWIFKGMINSIKMDMAAVFHIPGWESEQATLGNGISHFRNTIGKVDAVTIDWGRLTCLVNDVDGSDTDHRWGFTLGQYINSKNINSTSDNIYKHESGHTMQSRLIGPLFLSRVGLPSMISCKLINQGDGYHDLCWYEVWANNIGGAEEFTEYPKSYRKTSFGYWFKTIVFPFYPN